MAKIIKIEEFDLSAALRKGNSNDERIIVVIPRYINVDYIKGVFEYNHPQFPEVKSFIDWDEKHYDKIITFLSVDELIKLINE